MQKKIFHLALVALLISGAVAKRGRKTKRTKGDEESTPQPNVVTYSTFGFNDVGSYDGFVPSSPDYATYLSKYSQDSSTRLYAPAFPTAQDVTGPASYGSPSEDTQQQTDDGPQASMLQYQQNSMNYYNGPNDKSYSQGQNQEIYSRNEGEGGAPMYGAKIGSKGRGKNPFNNTAEFSGFGEAQAASNNENKFASFHEVYNSKQPAALEQTKNYQDNFNYAPNYQSSDNEDQNLKTDSSNTQSALKFPKVIDYTKYKQYYPTDLDTNKYLTTTAFPSYGFESNTQHDNPHSQSYSNTVFSFNNAFTDKEREEKTEKQVPKPTSYNENEFSQNYYGHSQKGIQSSVKSNLQTEYKDKFKYKPWTSTNYTNDYKNWKNPLKGYQFSSDFSNTSFEFDFSGDKYQNGDQNKFNSNNDEYVPASSNVVDLASYKFPDNDFSFKKIPGIKDSFGEEYSGGLQSYKHFPKYDPEAYVRSLYSTVPTTTTQWGNVYKPLKFSSYKHHSKKPYFGDDGGDDIVHIPKRPYSSKYGGRYTEAKPSEWSYNSYKPYKSKKPFSDWGEEISSNRFKSEEDLLGLRNHDTSHPSYLPTYRPSENSLANDYNDYKKLVEKWRQSYLKAKYKDAYSKDFESFPSEQRPVHVPVPKPYPIEVPHPVIVPVPQPYPVRVPIPKPVAVPVVQEITVPVEKPVPYPVIKKVPYPIEKPVPVRVEKQVQVPVIKPYPVHIPHVRPVFHHTRPREDYDAAIDVDEEEDYMPRPEGKRVPYAKRLKSPRSRARRPPRAYTYQDRNRRRWPSTARRPADARRPRPPVDLQLRPYRPRDQEDDDSDYLIYCKRTGNC